jgi:PAS domain S-box-containing protein
MLWNAPELPEPVRNATASRFLWLLVLMTLAYSCVGGILLIALEPHSWTRFAGLALGVIGASIGGWLGWSGKPWAGLNVTCGFIIVGLGYALIHNGGSDAPAFFACVPFVTTLVFAYGPRAALAFIGACLAWVGFVEWAAARELVGPPPPLGPGVRLLMGSFNLLWALSASTLSYLIFRRALGDVAEGESRFEILSQATFESIAITEQGVILDANDSFAELVGYSREDLLGKSATLMVAPEFRAAIEERFRAGTGDAYEHKLQRKDGTKVVVESRARLLPYKGRLVRVTAIRDLSDRRKAEADLRRSEELLRLALDGARMGLWIVDFDSGRIERSDRMREFFDGDEPIGVDGFLERIHPDDRAATAEALAACHEGRRDNYERVDRIRRLDGSYRWLESRGRVSRDARGRPVRLAGTTVDVTERKNVEAVLEKSRVLLAEANAELERKVADRTAALEAANRELEAFAYSVSHDLRAPLRAMHGFAQALGEDCAAVLPPQGLDYLERIRAASRRMGELIECLLELSRITRAELRREDVDLSALAASVGAELARANGARTVELVIEPGLRARADPRLLVVVLTNLLANAWKFTSRMPAARVVVGSARDAQGALSFFVKDNGAGFDPRHASRLFTAFTRLHAAKDYPGTGVGLATVQRAIQRHGGRVWAESSPGAGATFFFTLAEPLGETPSS